MAQHLSMNGQSDHQYVFSHLLPIDPPLGPDCRVLDLHIATCLTSAAATQLPPERKTRGRGLNQSPPPQQTQSETTIKIANNKNFPGKFNKSHFEY